MENSFVLIVLLFAALATGGLIANRIGLGRAMYRLSVSAYVAFHQHANRTFDPCVPIVVIGALTGGIALAVRYGVHSISGQLAAAGAPCYAPVIIIGVPTCVRINHEIASGSIQHPPRAWAPIRARRLGNFALCALVLLPLAAIAQRPTPSLAHTDTVDEHRADEAAIEHVITQFHDAVVAHDGAALSSLFLPDANIWLNVLTDAAYDRAQAGAANTSKVRVSSYRDFAKFVSATRKSLDAEHSNVMIHTDGTIAAVYFDFVFKIDGKAENRGSETWQMVKAVGGWRIAAISYSCDPAMQQ